MGLLQRRERGRRAVAPGRTSPCWFRTKLAPAATIRRGPSTMTMTDGQLPGQAHSALAEPFRKAQPLRRQHPCLPGGVGKALAQAPHAHCRRSQRFRLCFWIPPWGGTDSQLWSSSELPGNSSNSHPQASRRLLADPAITQDRARASLQ